MANKSSPARSIPVSPLHGKLPAPPPLGKMLTGETKEEPEFFGSANFVIPGMQNKRYSQIDVEQAFNVIDYESRDYLDKNTIRHALHMSGETCSEDEIDEMIRMVDFDANGRVSLSGMKHLFLNPPPIFRNYDLGKHEALEFREMKGAKKKPTIAVNKKSLDRENAAKVMREFAGEGGLNPSFIKNIYQRFMEMDKDNSGDMTYDEFCQLLQCDSSPLLSNMFRMFDKDGSGTIDAKEIIVGLSAYATSTPEEKLKFAFLMFDNDQSGFLERDEVAKIVRSNAPELTDDQIKHRINELYSLVNVPPKARLSFNDFRKIVRKKPEIIASAFQITRAIEQMQAS